MLLFNHVHKMDGQIRELKQTGQSIQRYLCVYFLQMQQNLWYIVMFTILKSCLLTSIQPKTVSLTL